jgi:FkbM family methyltransferase
MAKDLSRRGWILLVIFGALLGFAIGRLFFGGGPVIKNEILASSLLTALDRYAPDNYSLGNEQIIIRHFFMDRMNGFFVDVGAAHYKEGNNTYYLEERLGWSGIAIDANNEFAEGYLKFRPRTSFFNLFVSDISDKEASFNIVDDNKLRDRMRSTAIKSFVNKWKSHEIQVPTITLNDLLDRMSIKNIDFLNMDIERWEPRALAGFDIKKYHPDLVCIALFFRE